MNDNEKAAIAAGLMKEPRLLDSGKFDIHLGPIPDMHDPANLWLALEKTAGRCAILYDPIGQFWCAHDREGRCLVMHTDTACEALFAALVALYDAEPPI